jgi:hypothetical protein
MSVANRIDLYAGLNKNEDRIVIMVSIEAYRKKEQIIVDYTLLGVPDYEEWNILMVFRFQLSEWMV